MMAEVVFRDVVGAEQRMSGVSLGQLDIPEPVLHALTGFFGRAAGLSPPQQEAVDSGVISDDAHFLISAPTNSGKTLIAFLRVFAEAVGGGGRSVYVVPLKALAEEKLAEMERLAGLIAAAGGPRVRIRVSTGDYQLSRDLVGSPPPDSGEILVCTPERLEVLLRNPDHADWARSVKTVVIDEFHLLGEQRRGATVESLVTRLLMDFPQSCILALSATIGGLDDLAGWLGHRGKPVRVISSSYRYPRLRRQILLAGELATRNAVVRAHAKALLQRRSGSMLVFVYRKDDAKRLAREIAADSVDSGLVEYFHAGRSLAERKDIAKRYREGDIRVLVATTSLKMGINTPATEVVIRDTLFFGLGNLPVADLLQMLGRAGRGDESGEGIVLCDSREVAEQYASAFASDTVEPLAPQLRRVERPGRKRKSSVFQDEPDPLRALLLAEIARRPYVTVAELQGRLEHSYSGWLMGLVQPDISGDLAVLERGKLVFAVENAESSFEATKLGRTTAFSGLSPESGAMLGAFLRALIRLGEKETTEDSRSPSFLGRIRDIDLIALALASFEGRTGLLPAPRLSESGSIETYRQTVEEYIEALPSDEKPLLNLWRNPESLRYPTRRLLSSLQLVVGDDPLSQELGFLRLMHTAIVLDRHARGESLETLAEQVSADPGKLESNLKYNATWVLSCIAQICSSDRCYKLDFLAMRAFALLEALSIGSSLGRLMTLKGVGRSTVDKLIHAGFRDLDALNGLDAGALHEIGVGTGQAGHIRRFLKRSGR